MAANYRVKRGLDLPISGSPRQAIEDAQPVQHVAVLGPDFVGMRPTMAVAEGDDVKLGQVLFEDKKQPGVLHTAPGSGKVVAVNRGAKRVLQSVVIELCGDAAEDFSAYARPAVEDLTAEQVREGLIRSGLWVGLRTRPFSRSPAPDSVPRAIFVNAMDTNPLAADPQVVLAGHEDAFGAGLVALSKLTEGAVYVCKAPGASIPAAESQSVQVAEFAGPHPAGLSGTHIHFLDPVGPGRTVWTVGYQDVMAMGHLFTTGQLRPDRVVAVAGPMASRPRLVRTRIGACISEGFGGEATEGDVRTISGPVLQGRTAQGALDYLGRFHLQVSLLAEGHERELLGWQMPGLNKFSAKIIFASRLLSGKKFAMTTSVGGSDRAMVPIGSYELVMPLDILATYLLRALIVEDTDRAQALGCLELDEEDLALCTFVSPGKVDLGPILRRNLETIEREG
jgi:Na+-transporting NADH:ubiquinone oxidoreductase subunit A